MKEISHLKLRERSILIGICTDDFSSLYDIIRILKHRKIPHTILQPGAIWETRMDCLLISNGLRPPIFTLSGPECIMISKDPLVDVDRAVALSFGISEPKLLVIGIDPGKRPGMAFLADGLLISIYRASGPDDVLQRIDHGRTAYRPRAILIRMGDGDPSSRDPILGMARKQSLPLELVDESRTTTTKKFRDENAAVLIAHTKGAPIPVNTILS